MSESYKEKEGFVSYFKPHIDLVKQSVECEYVERPFSNESERMALFVEMRDDLSDTKEFLHEWFGARVADEDGELPSNIDEAMTALASFHHVIAKLTAGKWRNDGNDEAHTDRDRVTLAKNHVLAAINELENTSESYDARIPGLISVLGNAEDALADVLKDREIAAGMSLANALYWRVTATDEHGEPITMGAFYTEGDAEEYAKRLDGMGWDAEVEEIA